VRKASDLGLDVTAELVRFALEATGRGEGGEEEAGSSSEEDEAEAEAEEEEGPMASEAVEVPGPLGHVLVQFELAPRRQRLALSLVSLGSADLGEVVLRYAFAVGLTSACLLEAESAHHELEHLELAEWRSEERGAMQPPEGLPPAPSVERRARAFVDFFSRGEGARPPIAPRDVPAESLFSVGD
jgi:hypothetical protein